MLSTPNQRNIEELIRQVNSLPLPDALSQALADYQSAKNKVLAAIKICQFFLNFNKADIAEADIASFEPIFNEFLNSALMQALNCLREKNLLEGLDNFTAVLQHEEPLELAKAILALKKENLLEDAHSAPTIYAAVVQHRMPMEMVQACVALKGTHLLAQISQQSFFQFISKHEHPSIAAQAFVKLNTDNLLEILGKARIEIVLKHVEPLHMVRILNYLNEAQLLSSLSGQENFKIVSEHKKLEGLEEAVEVLTRSKLLGPPSGQANFEAVAKYPCEYPQLVARALEQFKLKLSADALSKDIQDAVDTRVADKEVVGLALMLLKEKNLIEPFGSLDLEDERRFQRFGFVVNQLLSMDIHAQQDFLSLGPKLLSFGIKLNANYSERLYEEAMIEVNKRVHTVPLEITWDLVQLLGIIYQPGSKHPIHGQLKEAMQTGVLQTILASAGVQDPVLALKLVFRLLESEKTLLFSWIKSVFGNSNQSDQLTFVKTEEWRPELIELADALKDCLINNKPAMTFPVARPTPTHTVGASSSIAAAFFEFFTRAPSRVASARVVRAYHANLESLGGDATATAAADAAL